MKFKFKNGQLVKDKITGFKGIVICRMEYLTGCNRYSIQSKKLHNGKPVEWQHFDEDQLELIEDEEKHIKIETDKNKGGWKHIPIKK